jgi:hypothetical protein
LDNKKNCPNHCKIKPIENLVLGDKKLSEPLKIKIYNNFNILPTRNFLNLMAVSLRVGRKPTIFHINGGLGVPERSCATALPTLPFTHATLASVV